MSPKFGDGHSLKRYAPKLLVGIIFEIYYQHTQIITELDIKLNKWHITIEKLYRQPTETEQNFKKFMTLDRTANLKCSKQELSHCASRQLCGSSLKCPYKAGAHSFRGLPANIVNEYFRGHSHSVQFNIPLDTL